MEQFFILKKYRRRSIGTTLALHVFQSHPGPWEVGEMQANRDAQAFWRKVVGQVAGSQVSEVHVTQGWWQGVVQQFDVPAAA